MESYKVVLTKAALNDLDDIGTYVAHLSGSRTTSYRLVGKIKRAIGNLSNFCHYQLLDNPDLKHYSLRRITIKHYNVYFTVSDKTKEVTIIAVLYGSRNVTPLLHLRLSRLQFEVNWLN